jgi:hypothetical protein
LTALFQDLQAFADWNCEKNVMKGRLTCHVCTSDIDLSNATS